MSNTTMYDLSIDQVANVIAIGAHKRSVLVQGDMGCGKSSLLPMLSEQYPDHELCYFDATTKDLGDLSVPNLLGSDGKDFVTFSPNEEFGIHLNKPVILMIDEFGKANPMVKQGLTRVILEHMVGSRKLPEGSLVFATTNLGEEGVGDLLQGHQRNRLTIVTMRKPTNEEWITWALNNGIDSSLLSWVKESPQLFQSFKDTTANDNPYIYHPSEQRDAFVTPRSLHSASDWLLERDKLDEVSLTATLIGTIGARGALDLMAYVRLADQLPSVEDIKKNPKTAKIPTSSAGVCMIVYRTLAIIEKDWVDSWLEYMERLDTEAQGLFVNGARQPKYKRQREVMTNKKFGAWARSNAFLFTADK